MWVTCTVAESMTNLPVVPGWMEAQAGSLAAASLAVKTNAAEPFGVEAEGSGAKSKHW